MVWFELMQNKRQVAGSFLEFRICVISDFYQKWSWSFDGLRLENSSRWRRFSGGEPFVDHLIFPLIGSERGSGARGRARKFRLKRRGAVHHGINKGKYRQDLIETVGTAKADAALAALRKRSLALKPSTYQAEGIEALRG